MYELKAPGAKRRSKKLKIDNGINIPSLLSYQKLLNFINSIDIGTIKGLKEDFSHNLADDDKIEGNYRDLSEILLILADLYFFCRIKVSLILNTSTSLNQLK